MLKKLQSSTNLKSSLETHDACTQTDPPDEEMASLSTLLSQPTVPGTEDQCSEWSSATGAKSAMSIAEEVKKVAENAMQQTGFVYEETSGMYYDYNTGYYYNAVSTFGFSTKYCCKKLNKLKSLNCFLQSLKYIS